MKSDDVLSYVVAHPGVTTQGLAAALALPQRRVQKYCKSLVSEGRLRRSGSAFWAVAPAGDEVERLEIELARVKARKAAAVSPVAAAPVAAAPAPAVTAWPDDSPSWDPDAEAAARFPAMEPLPPKEVVAAAPSYCPEDGLDPDEAFARRFPGAQLPALAEVDTGAAARAGAETLLRVRQERRRPYDALLLDDCWDLAVEEEKNWQLLVSGLEAVLERQAGPHRLPLHVGPSSSSAIREAQRRLLARWALVPTLRGPAAPAETQEAPAPATTSRGAVARP